jgi:hypothetical protein
MQFPFFEALMLVCFGCAWPASIMKSWHARTARGKSILFMLIVLVGYLAGITNKFVIQDHVDAVVWFYVGDIVMVLIDLALTLRNRRLDLSGSPQP